MGEMGAVKAGHISIIIRQISANKFAVYPLKK